MLNDLKNIFTLLLLLTLLLSLLFAVDAAGLYPLNRFGIVPRQLQALPNILAAPFLHGSWLHLSNNLLGLYIFAGLCLALKSRRYFLYCSGFIIVIGGFMVWCFARPAIHIGASGWVFGLWSLCIANAYYERRAANFLVAIIVVFFYGGMIYGVLPSDARVSFESHLGGALAGIGAARALRKLR